LINLPFVQGGFIIFRQIGIIDYIMQQFKIGLGVDFHQLVAGRDFWLGGIKIPHTKGALGHSDADVLLHAICDAMLGAASLGDIGVHFPDTDASFKDIDSKILLQKTKELLASKGYRTINVDVALCLQAPKIKPYVSQMKEVIAAILDLDISCVSIKASTTENMGFVGREEGVVAYASALVGQEEAVTVKFKNESKHPLPAYATADAAGMDIRANIEAPLALAPLERVLVPTGLYMELPRGYEAQLRPRSGLAIKQGLTLLNTPGTIDADYRGEIKIIMINLSQEVQTIEPGDRIAQMVIAPCMQAQVYSVTELSETERGAGGFGHTGKL
jgi:2-C-methyl-D-erythritol 2,4-cyclodiphosphate synthase